MINYTERLKIYWKSKDLIFIATFKKLNKNAGFFNYFTNPISKMRLYYPIFDDLDIVDKQVSFFHNKASELVDGNYYKIELEYTNNPKGKNNPYSLKIKNISALNQDKVKELLEEGKKNDLESTTFYGSYHLTNDVFASFENVMYSVSGKIFMINGESLKVFVPPRLLLEENTYYSFSINENEGKLPNAIPDTIQKLEFNPYLNFVNLRLERRKKDPESNKIIAHLMREIGKGMYSSKQRMIFELLQNADDSPGKEKVEFHIDVKGDYLFVMHDGAPFNKNDVEAITSAAQSTKKNDKKKTGYKGIGFKSVFTDSTEVWLKSGGYQFVFSRNNVLFDDFETFYFSSSDHLEFPKLIEKHRKEYEEDIKNYDSTTDVPWQIIPIWQNKLPSEFRDSNFDNFNNPVQFALKVGETHIYSKDGYLDAIENVVKKPQFLLFLRNTSKFRSTKNRTTVSRIDKGGVILIEKITVEYVNGQENQNKQAFEYSKQVYKDIEVSDKAFADYNIGIKRIIKKNDLKEDVVQFADLNGDLIEAIPPKLASSTETEVSFGILLLNGKLTTEKGYSDNEYEYSSLFTYLPMEDKRFKLPFLVNADFIPDSRRESLQGDNLWNKYIMIKVAEKHVTTLSYYAQEFIKDNSLFSSYLSLLLKNPLPADDTAQQIIDSYNQKYLEQLNVESIVVNDKNQSQLLSETILDTSGLTQLFGHEIFYEIIETEKYLPHSNLDASYLLKYDYLAVEIIDLEELAKYITPEICDQLGKIIAEKSLYEKPELLKWLDLLVIHIPKNFADIPFIVHNKALYSIEQLLKEDGAWLINNKTLNYEELFKGLGYNTVNLNINEYSNINNYLLSFGGYINDKTLAYDRIAINSNLSNLDISLKLNLIDFLKNSEFMMGIGKTKYYGELELFVDENGTARPLYQLLSRQVALDVASIQKFRVLNQEYDSLTSELINELIAKNKVFTSFILDNNLFKEWSQQFTSQNIKNYVDDLKTIYSWKNEDEEILQSKWADIPWLYIDDESRFFNTDKVFWSNAFQTLSFEEYQTIKEIFHFSELKTLPLKSCGDIIQPFKLKTDDSSGIGWTRITDLNTLSANTLLDWIENDGNNNDFFTDYTLQAKTDGKWSICEIGNTQIFDGSDKVLKTYINSNEGLNSLFTELDKSLCCDTRNKIGLLQGDKLIKAIIESKAYEQNLATLLPSSIPWEQLSSFILNLSVLNLTTGVIFDSNSPEHIIIHQLLRAVEDINAIPDDVQNAIDNLRGKIEINQNPLSKYNISDRITFGIKENRKVLNLSDVLEEFQGDSDELESVKESFVSITHKEKLRKLIFKTRQLQPNEIHSKIEEEVSTYYTVHQVVFQLLYKNYVGEQNWSKQKFDDYWIKKENEIQLQSSYKSFLDVLFEIDFTEISDFIFHNLVLTNRVDKNYAIESEIIPQWLVEWINIDQPNRKAFISKLGYHGVDSPIVKLRKAAVSESFDSVAVIGHYAGAKKSIIVVWNTIKWLSNFSSHIITRNIELIKQINNDVTLSSIDLKDVIIPVITSINSDSIREYILQSVAVNSNLFFLPDNEEFAYSIFKAIKKEDESTLIINSSCGTKSNHFNTKKIQLNEGIDIDLLEGNSELWEEPFYKKWEFYAKYPIYIYNGNEIPYKRTFNGITINKYTSDLKVVNNGKYYVSNVLKKDVLNSLPSAFPANILTHLKEYHYNTLQNESLLDEDPYEEKYNETFDRMIQDRFGISKERQNEENNNAKRQALYFLKEEGYNVDQGNSQINYSALYNIINPDGNKVNCIVRSAKGGLLYLDKEHWDMLEDSQMYLIVIYPGNSPRLFKNRIELLEEDLAENILFRVPNNKHADEIDGVFDALESESHLILVTSEKMKESLFSKLKQNRNFKNEENAAVGGDDYRP